MSLQAIEYLITQPQQSFCFVAMPRGVNVRMFTFLDGEHTQDFKDPEGGSVKNPSQLKQPWAVHGRI